jgi:16S rRNA (guanine(1405)-N(7))-methyltransferase
LPPTTATTAPVLSPSVSRPRQADAEHGHGGRASVRCSNADRRDREAASRGAAGRGIEGAVPASEDDVVAAVLAGRRYRSLHPPLVRRVARAEAPAARSQAELVKRTKRALHQIFGAYLPSPPRYDRWLAELRAAAPGEDARAVLRRAMAQHASTRERLDHLEAFYAALAAHVGTPRSLLDVACGLQPLALPWWGLPAGTAVHAWDIDTSLVAFVGACLEALGLRAHAAAVDLLEVPAWPTTEVALVLKTLPCLEQQAPGAGEALLAAIPAPRVVVSFPTRSLGGRAKGMGATYARGFEALLSARGWSAVSFEVGPELVYVVTRPPAERGDDRSGPGAAILDGSGPTHGAAPADPGVPSSA